MQTTLICGSGQLPDTVDRNCSRQNTSGVAPRILLADDQEDILQAVADTLADGFDIVGTATTGEAAVKLATTLLPDVVVLDISMPDLNGLEAARQLTKMDSESKVVFLSVHADRDFVEAAFYAGGRGYVLKAALATDLIPAIRAVLEGSTFISPSMHLR